MTSEAHLAELVRRHRFDPPSWTADLGPIRDDDAVLAEVRALGDPDRGAVLRDRAGVPLAGAVLTPHESESAVLGIRSFRVGSLHTGAERSPGVLEQLGSRLLELARRRGGGVVIVRTDTADTAALVGLQAAGFVVYDASAVLHCVPGHDEGLTAASAPHRIVVLDRSAIRALAPGSYAEIVAEAARAFRRSHFHADPRVSSARADDLYASWVRNSFEDEWSDLMLTAWEGDTIVALAGFSERVVPGRAGPLRVLDDAISLRLERSEPGVGAALYRTVMATYRGDLVRIATSLAGPYLRIVLGSPNFRALTSSFTLHGWTDP